ncbi:MAG: isoleucine--tRNA ligase [Leptonema sp. (in: bacteria)]
MEVREGNSSKSEFVELEEMILKFWKKNKIFEKHIKRTHENQCFVFYEGPPTANGKPGIHHVLSRVYKDIYIRYYGLKGYYVPRKAGWDCHGLPVEREVEKELNIQTKSEIEEKYGLEKFNQLCRESVLKYVDAWNEFSERLGFWVDLKNPYYTMDNEYIESVWYLLKLIYKKGLLYKGYKVVPFDPIMGTTVSDAEVALGYKEVIDPSLTVKFRIIDSTFTNTFFLVWTTTPWTLPANVALAVHPEEEYVLVQVSESENYILATKLLSENFKHLTGEYKILQKYKGKDLQGVRYERIFDFIELPENEQAFYVVCGDFVTMDVGTGIVHIAPAYGADDLEIGKKYNLPIIYGVQLDGKFSNGPYKGKFFKEADKEIIRDLKARNIVFKLENYKHDYPFGWRSGAPLMYFAKEAWYIKTTAIKDQLIKNNQTINWVPSYIKDGRFGNWLENNKDWALSRERYWGTPLPIWMDEDGNIEFIASKKELEKKVKRKLDHLDLHRPYIDEITWVDPKTKKIFRRVPEVIDCWFDSGAMPYAQWGWPYRNKKKFEKFFPADFISEAVDQTRGWFYTLLAISTLVSDQTSYKNVVCLGHVLDIKGEKMSKSKGNTVDPWEVFNTYGADAIRWYFLTGAPPGNSRRIGKPGQSGDPLVVVTGFFKMVFNILEFLKIYSQVDQISYKKILEFSNSLKFSELQEIDQWILSYLQELIQQVTEYLDQYETMKPGKLIEEFIDSLSNWYIRRNRRRFWKGELDNDKFSAYFTLVECILKVMQLMSPLIPFLSEYIFLELREVLGIKKELPESIHLMSWPKPNFEFYDKKILEEGSLLQTIAFLGRSARQKAKIKIRQPLSKILIYAPQEKREFIEKGKSILLEELNVKEIEFIDDASGLFYYQVRPNLPVLGKRLGSKVKYIQEFLHNSDHNKIAGELNKNQKIQIPIEGELYEFEKEDFLIDGISKEGTQGAEYKGFVVAIDTNITPELYKEGLIRDLVRNIQEARKKAKLNINDRIFLKIETKFKELQEAVLTFKDYLQKETLSQLKEDIDHDLLYKEKLKIENQEVVIQIKKNTD